MLTISLLIPQGGQEHVSFLIISKGEAHVRPRFQINL